METRRRDWRTILLGIASLVGGFFLFLIAAFVIIFAVLGLQNKTFAQDAPPLLDAIILSSALTLIGAVFLVTSYYSLQRLRGKEVTVSTPKVLKIWQGFLLFFVWIGASILAQVFFNNQILKWFAPLLYLLAIATPVYFFIRLASGGLLNGSRLRAWGALFTTMSFGTLFSALAEIVLVVIGLVGAGVYFGLHQEQATAFKQLMEQLTNASNMDKMMNLIGPWLTNPLVVLLALVFFSGFTPLIEETAKSAAIWMAFDRLDSPAQGFVIGALSGAGFGLFESLLASVTPDAGWASTLLIRGGSTMMHIMTASLTGWGIASFRARKSFGHLIGGYSLAMLLHSTWNACVVLIVAGGLRIASHAGQPDVLGALIMALNLGLLLILFLAIPVILGSMNWKFRTSPSLTPTAPSAKNGGQVEHLPHFLPSEENGGGKEGVQ